MMKTRDALNTTVLSTIDELEAFAPDYERLFSASPDASPYFAFDPVFLALKHARRSQQPRICVVHDASGPVAVLPFVRVCDGPMGLPVLRVPGSGLALRFGPIVLERAGGLPILESALTRLRQRERWLYCQIRAIPADSPLLVAPSEPATRLRVRQEILGASTVVELQSSWDEYCTTLSRGFASEVRHDTRALGRDRQLRMVRLGLEPLADSPELERLIEDTLAVSRKSWQGAASWGTAISDPGVELFFREFCRRLAARGRLDLSVLYGNDEPISFIWGAARWPRTSVAKCGFDAALRKKAPGMVHHALYFQDSIARGFKEVELGHEFTQQKVRWSRRADELYKVWWYPAGLPAVAYWGRRGVHATKEFVGRARRRRAARRPAAELSPQKT